MKKLFEKLQYLSNRILILLLLPSVLLVFLMLMYVKQMVDFGAPEWPVLLTLLCMVVIGILLFQTVIIPYYRWEKIVNRFLDGYVPFEETEKTAVMLTPHTKREIEKVNEILNSMQVRNLNKRQAQYLALQNQINPHFLYNTLEGIRSEALIGGLDNVADMTEALATFFRYTISKVENLVSVEEELENCKTYFKIQQYRFGERLCLHVEYEEEDWEEILHCRIPKLTLQPILENSIIHGTELKIGTGNLTIHLERTEDRLIIRISDDGVGMDEKTLEKLNQKLGRNENQYAKPEQESKGGIALVNVNNRIHLLFGEEYGMHVFSVEGMGTDVELTIPAITSDRQVKNQGVL